MTDEAVDKIVSEVADLGDTLSKAISSLAENKSDDTALLDLFKNSFSELIKLASKFKQVDITPFSNVASDISKQNGSIMEMLGRLIHSQDNSVLISMVTEMVKRNNEFTANVFKQNDYSEQLSSVAESLKKEKQVIDYLTVSRDGGLVHKITVNYKKVK